MLPFVKENIELLKRDDVWNVNSKQTLKITKNLMIFLQK